MAEEVYFETISSLGIKIRVTKSYWNKIIETKHRLMKGKEDAVKEALKAPTEVRRSRKDRGVFLYYGKINGKYCCVVAKHLNGKGYIITAYMTDRIKIGEKYEAD